MKNQRNDTGDSGGSRVSSEYTGRSVSDSYEDLGEAAETAVNRAATGLRDQVSSAAEYFRDNGVQEVMDDVTKYVRSHPTQALIGAAVLGFVAGRMGRRS